MTSGASTTCGQRPEQLTCGFSDLQTSDLAYRNLPWTEIKCSWTSYVAMISAAWAAHMLAADTKIYRFNYRNQGQALGFIDPATKKMVMLHTDGKFWSAWKLGDKQFQNIIDKGFLT